jgi:cell division protein FtsA
MRSGPVAVMSIGSRYLRIVIAEKKSNNDIKVITFAETECHSIYDGEFIVEENELRDKIYGLIEEAEKTSRYRIKKLFVGLPSDFLRVDVKSVDIDIGANKKIDGSDISALAKKAEASLTAEGYRSMGASPVYYVLDDNRRIMQPIGMTSARLSALLSCISVKRQAHDLLVNILGFKGIHAEFISSMWSEMLGTFAAGERDRFVLFADIGFLSTSVALMRGDGILNIATITSGGGNIADDLMRCYDIDIKTAIGLMESADLYGENKTLGVKIGSASFYPDINSGIVNGIVGNRLTEIAKSIHRIIISGSYDCPPHIPLYLSGDGAERINGAGDVISRVIQRASKIVSVKDKLSGELRGLIEAAVARNASVKKSIFDFLKR